jgi:uncharacterized protein (DUF1800 family)
MTVSRQSVIAASRFGLGARPGELAAIGNDPRGWLNAQLESPVPTPAPIAALRPSAGILAEFQSLRRQRQGADGDKLEALQRQLRHVLGPAYQQQVLARYQAAVSCEQPFRERLVHFWSNHFAVSADKPPVTALAGSLENEVVRRSLDGSFAELLIAVVRHPAMLLYLDNPQSIGPNSTLASRARRFGRVPRKLGINENLGREILELHTLGANGGYDQQDVIALSKILTGWSVGGGHGRLRAEAPGEFVFREGVHEPGAHQLLGRRYRSDGLAQGEAALRDLARHPSTARHLSTRLARHFAGDEPPPGMVERLARVFLDTDGDLPSLHRAVIASPEAWQPEALKFKTPSEFVTSALRAVDAVPPRARAMAGSLMLLGQPAYRPGSPAGWPDTAEDWAGADALMKRIQWSDALAARLGPMAEPMRLVATALGPALSEHSANMIRRAETRRQGMTLALMSPEFQRR